MLETSSMDTCVGQLRLAIENLINVKLHDVLSHRDGLARLAAHRATGVASPLVRNAEAELEAAIAATLPTRKRGRVHRRLHATD